MDIATFIVVFTIIVTVAAFVAVKLEQGKKSYRFVAYSGVFIVLCLVGSPFSAGLYVAAMMLYGYFKAGKL